MRACTIRLPWMFAEHPIRIASRQSFSASSRSPCIGVADQFYAEGPKNALQTEVEFLRDASERLHATKVSKAPFGVPVALLLQQRQE
ncbi:hypothetical protein CBOM_07951 [Ceraceosorus bombacis]|uniref:Uncharacterized protein n=1 Tax=Ceraceosorus bombacis TaxID=401625 RepID=A0A0P1BSN6_9BASI|nr:hypothetical protein CBOM_07951 [Ceraceosorus bombacis]